MASPILLILFFVLLYNHKKESVKLFAEAAWAFPTALVLITGSLALLSFLFSTSTTYLLGMDVQTPSGDVSCYSMVEVNNRLNPIRSLRKIYMGELRVKGEAAFCELGDGQNLIATLIFKNDVHGTQTLSQLPNRAYECPQKTNFEEHNDPNRLNLCDKFIPILVSYTNVNNPMSLQLVDHNDISKQLGEGYSLRSVWIKTTDSKYTAMGIKEKLPCAAMKTRNGRSLYLEAFQKKGLGGISRPFIK
nr:hypothetical protein [uncultured Pseudodesulfovibrio sp.]